MSSLSNKETLGNASRVSVRTANNRICGKRDKISKGILFPWLKEHK
jgi:hypothetical protein